jgi:hypothetical protein
MIRADIINATAQAIADRLIGTADTSEVFVIEEMCETHELTPEECRSTEFNTARDELYFCCDQCGWYCDTEELNNETDENLCDDCNAE